LILQDVLLRTVAVWHHLAAMELLLSSRYMVPLCCSYCRSSQEHEFFDLREFLHAIELLRAVKENWLVYSKQTKKKNHCYTGSTRNWNLYSVLGNSKNRSSVRVTQAIACDRSAIRVTQAVACDRSAALALGIKTLFLCENLYFSPSTFSYHT
jgi:hypothetical protein